MNYNQNHQLKTITNGVTGVSPMTSSMVNYNYNQAGDVYYVQINTGTTSLLSTSYQYGMSDQIWRITPSIGHGFDFTYNRDNGHIKKSTTLGVGFNTTYTYDLMDRVINIRYDVNNTYAHDIAFTYYEDTSMIKDKTIDGYRMKRKHAYVYDSLDRLVSEDIFVKNIKVSSATYNYDLAGNRTTVVDNGVTSTYTLVPGSSGGNRLDSWGVHGHATYDVAGNTESLVSADGTKSQTFDWDERYRLTSVDDASSFVEYTYDVLGRKIIRTEGANVEHYIYDGNQIVADLDASGNPLRIYAYGSGIDNILSMTTYSNGQPADTYYYVKDHQNTVIALANRYGFIVESYDYDAYGRILDVKDSSGSSIANQKSAIGNRYTFQGREIDWDTGLMYFRARWYNPETGRWLSKDPIGISGGLNLYVFCGNNPVNFIDPMGLSIRQAIAAAASAIHHVVTAVATAAVVGGSFIMEKVVDVGSEALFAADVINNDQYDSAQSLADSAGDLSDLAEDALTWQFSSAFWYMGQIPKEILSDEDVPGEQKSDWDNEYFNRKCPEGE